MADIHSKIVTGTRIAAALMFAGTLIAAWLVDTVPAFGALGIVSTICLVMVSLGPESSDRAYGTGFFVIAAVIAVAAEMADESWPMKPEALAVLALTTGIF